MPLLGRSVVWGSQETSPAPQHAAVTRCGAQHRDKPPVFSPVSVSGLGVILVTEEVFD